MYSGICNLFGLIFYFTWHAMPFTWNLSRRNYAGITSAFRQILENSAFFFFPSNSQTVEFEFCKNRAEGMSGVAVISVKSDYSDKAKGTGLL